MATATATTTATETKADPKAKTKVEAVPHPKLLALVKQYDESIEQAESYFVDMCEMIQKEQIDRATTVATLMKARGITFETAQSQYSRMKGILNNQETLQELKDGKITLRVAREKTTKKQSNPKNAKPEAKEARYNTALKTLVACVKENGFDLKSALVSFEAELKAAGVK
jgi:hypothetical protein